MADPNGHSIMPTVYRSKVDAWLLVVTGFGMAVSFCATAAIAATTAFSANPIFLATALAIVASGVGLPLWLLLSTRYTLEPLRLVVRSGPFRWRIALADIVAISPTSAPHSSPALSLDRLRIDYGRGRSLMISPRDKQQFLSAMQAARKSLAQ